MNLVKVLVLGMAGVLVTGCGTQTLPKQASQSTKAVSNKIDWDNQEINQSSSTDQIQTNNQQYTDQVKPYLSAARPVIEDGRTPATESEMHVLATKSEQYFKTQELFEVLSKSKNGDPQEGIPLTSGSGVTMFYRTSQPIGAGEVPLIAVGYGLGANAIESHAFLWFEDGIWKSQPYPQSSEETAKKREGILSEGPFATTSFEEIHQRGTLVAVLVRYLGSQMAEEVQLLQRDQNGFHVLWVPTYDDWQTLNGSHIVFHDGMSGFTVERTDIKDPAHKWKEEWQLQGSKYVMNTSTK